MAGGGLAFLAALLMGWQSLAAEALLDDEQEESAATSFSWGLRQQVGLAVGILGGLAGFLLNGDNTFTAWGFSLWVIGCLAIVLAFWPPRGRLRFRLPSLQPSSAWVLVALTLILGLAAFFRFYDLDNTLREMVGDHAVDIFDIKRVSDGAHPVYFTLAKGREGLSFYLGAGLAPFFGHSFLTIKILTAIIGVLTVGATYFMTKELFGNRGVALIAGLAGLMGLAGLAGAPLLPALLLVAVAVGFLPWNWHPARIFLGDVGSVPPGFMLGWLLLDLAGRGAWAAALILPAYFLADATWTLARRALRGEAIWRAHREHFYQRAVHGGLSHAAAVRAVLACNAALVSCAALSLAGTGATIAALCAAAVSVAALLWYFRSAARRPPRPGGQS